MALSKTDFPSSGSATCSTCLPSQEMLFANSLPSLETLSSLICDLDQQLHVQDQKIEDTLQKLVDATNGLSTDNMYTNIKDAMDSLVHTSVLEECACLPPDSDDVNKLLKIINDHLTNHPGSEEVVFQQLLYIASHEGFSLPIRAPKLENITASSLSLNTVSDTMEIENDSLWEDLRGRLKKSFLDKLSNIQAESGNTDLSQRRVEMIQSICILYPVKDVWISYQNLRSQQVTTSLNLHLNSCKTAVKDEGKLETLNQRLSNTLSNLKSMMNEDFEVFVSDVFENEVDLKTALWEIYIASFNEELQNLLDDVWNSKKSQKSSHANGHTAEGIHSGRFVGKNSFEGESTAKPGTLSLTCDEIKHIIAIANSLSNFNQFYQSLCQQSSWDSTLAFKLPPKGRGHLKGVLKHKRDNSPRDHPLDFTRKGILPDAIPPPFGATPGMMADSSPRGNTHVFLETPKNKWQWFYLLEKFLPSVMETFSNALTEDLLQWQQDEDKVWEEKNVIPMVAPPGEDYQGCTCKISKCTGSVITKLSSLLSLVEMLWSEPSLKFVKSSYIKITNYCMEKLVDHLTKKADDFSSSKNGSKHVAIHDMYVILSSVVLLSDWLIHVEAAMSEDENGKTFSSMCKHLSTFRQRVVEQILLYHDRIISTIILQDAESNNWTDQRAFFEGERCSFSVEMWNLHLQGVKQDLLDCCPPCYTRELFVAIFSNSLEILSMRYSRAKPSYKRTKQFSVDIILILMASLEHLFFAVDSLHKFLPSKRSIQAHDTSTIHNVCFSLLGPLAVVASPLMDLYKVYKKGFAQRKRFREDKDSDPSWLGWVWPDLFGSAQEWPDLTDGAAVFLVVKLMSCQASPSYDLLMQALLMRNNLLPVLLARETTDGADSSCLESTSEPRQGHSKLHYAESHKQLLFAIAQLLSVCHDHPKSLSSFLLAILERDYSLRGSDGMDDTSSVDVPIWMACMYDLIKGMLVRTIKKAVSCLQSGNHTRPIPGFLETLRQLPCGCRIRNKVNPSREKDTEGTFVEACKETILSLVNEVKAMSLPLCIFFYKLEQMLPDCESKERAKCGGIKVLSQLVLRFTRSEIELQKEVLSGPVNPALLKQVAQLGEVVFTLLMRNSPDNPTVPTNHIQAFVRQYGEFLKETTSFIKEHFCNKSLSEHRNLSLENSPLQFQESYYKMWVNGILHHPNGEDNLFKVYKAVSDNVDWIQHILEVPPMPSLSPPSTPPTFHLDLSRPSDHTLALRHNPFTSYRRIGSMKFSQQSLTEFPIQWQKILTSDIGLTKAGFNLLLSHRHEMQEDAYLEESEKKAIRVLKSRYNLEQADLV